MTEGWTADLRPLVQLKGANSRDVGAQIPVDSGALDADKGAQIQAGPVGIWQAAKGRHESRKVDIYHWHLPFPPTNSDRGL